MKDYTSEQNGVEEMIKKCKENIDDSSVEILRADKFIALVKKYTDFNELTDKMLYEFIDRVEVHAPVGTRADRTMKIDIYFNFIGKYEQDMNIKSRPAGYKKGFTSNATIINKDGTMDSLDSDVNS